MDNNNFIIYYLLQGIFNVELQKINNYVSIHAREDRFVDWNSLNNYALREISDVAYKIQRSFREEKFHDCCTLGCNNEVCINSINNLYESIVNSITISSYQFSKKII